MRRLLYILLMCTTLMASCSVMREDRSDCPECDPNAPRGLYVKFKYDYNLQRADMFNDHVQAVTLYVLDQAGNVITTRTEANSPESQPLECDCYRMNIRDLAPGKYNLVAIAQTPSPLDPTQDSEKRAKFRWPAAVAPETPGFRASGISNIRDLQIRLDHTDTIPHVGLPLDTLWHGMDIRALELTADMYNNPVYDTISLVRDTKQILISICELDSDEPTTIDNYDITIIDRNTRLLWDNSLDETELVTYTPFARWNATDPVTDGGLGDRAAGLGSVAQCEFMTSRILYHENRPEADAVLTIHDSRTGDLILQKNLVYLLSYLRSYMDRRYGVQEFLDRCHDYTIEFFLQGGKYQYTCVKISTLSWSKRVQEVEL